jgi:hypothetical protein
MSERPSSRRCIFLPGKLSQRCFGPGSNELDGIEEVFFLGSQLLKAILFWQVLDQDMLKNCFALGLELLDFLVALFDGLLQLTGYPQGYPRWIDPFLLRLNNWWVKLIGLLTRYEAGSQVFLRVTNFKSLRQVASYAI